MYNKMFSEFDKLKAPQNAVDRAVSSAINKNNEINDTGIMTIKKRRFYVSGLAACLVLTFLCTIIFASRLSAKVNDSDMKSYGFVLSANAAQVEKLAVNDRTVIGAYAATATGGWAMYQKLEQYEEFSPNFFQSYGFSNFVLEGENIESVTFKAKGEGTYFSISPAGYFVNADEDKAEEIKQSAMKDYSDMSLLNSQYTSEELKAYSDGLSYGDIYCDVFTYKNTSGNKRIDFSNKLEYVLESNRKDEEISEMLDAIWECEQKLIEIRSTHTFEGGELTEEEEKLYNQIYVLSQDIRRLVIKDAEIEVTVTFADTTTETKILSPDLIYTEDFGLWLTLSAE